MLWNLRILRPSRLYGEPVCRAEVKHYKRKVRAHWCPSRAPSGPSPRPQHKQVIKYTTGAIGPAQDGRLPATSGCRPTMAGGPSPKGHKDGPCENGRPQPSSYRPQVNMKSKCGRPHIDI
ncbi:hypothetical protein CROQUDRAFT_96891 [Cronartium quercuum f. sp. fusiforme G11]|uniref:Uncharacterized protein n=1 Tax=Cronartium quercuum f. sp. fusiforme G11 TaxID=708437 RepID=A0A9P6T8F7_9BASI|nr:hypothetical protein CROQUDRAFT_96891 [Cronartium quercuum f. sp. fusiforme G11]